MAINKIMVLGAGTMGMGIAQVFAEAGKTVIVRLLDPPLHEFLDNPRDYAVELAHAEDRGESDIHHRGPEERDALPRLLHPGAG